MSQLILTRGTSYRRNLTNRYLKNFQIGPYFLISSLVLFVSLITVLTLMFSAKQITKGYVLNQLESQHQELLREGERKDMEISQVRSLTFIEESSKVSSMVTPGQVVYVSGETAIASK